MPLKMDMCKEKPRENLRNEPIPTFWMEIVNYANGEIIEAIVISDMNACYLDDHGVPKIPKEYLDVVLTPEVAKDLLSYVPLYRNNNNYDIITCNNNYDMIYGINYDIITDDNNYDINYGINYDITTSDNNDNLNMYMDNFEDLNKVDGCIEELDEVNGCFEDLHEVNGCDEDLDVDYDEYDPSPSCHLICICTTTSVFFVPQHDTYTTFNSFPRNPTYF